MNDELFWEFTDAEWPFTFTDHDRWIVRAIVFDEEGYFYFVRVLRDDHFGKATLIETCFRRSGASSKKNSARTSTC